MNWYPCWSYRFQNYESLKTKVKNFHQTLTLKNNIDGEAIRVLFSNQYGQEVLNLDHMLIKINNQVYPLTHNGCHQLSLQPNEDIYSDEIKINLHAKNNLIVEISIQENEIHGYVGLNSHIMIDIQQDGYMNSGVLKKNFNSYVYFGIKAIEVLSHQDVCLITAFGDSLIHQGYWMNHLFYELYQRRDNVVVLNEGISGNRLLKDATSSSRLNSIFQKAGIKRFEEDVFQRYHPDLILFAEGINDLVHPGNGCHLNELPSSEEMKKGYQRIESIVKKYNTKLLFMTLTPFYNYDGTWSLEKECIRETVNQWIKVKENIDIDSLVREDKKLKTCFDGGDHLHFNEDAGQYIAKYIVNTILMHLEKEG